MMAMATTRLKLDTTPPRAMAAWFGAFASRARASAGSVPDMRRIMESSMEKIDAERRGMSAMPPINSSAMAR